MQSRCQHTCIQWLHFKYFLKHKSYTRWRTRGIAVRITACVLGLSAKYQSSGSPQPCCGTATCRENPYTAARSHCTARMMVALFFGAAEHCASYVEACAREKEIGTLILNLRALRGPILAWTFPRFMSFFHDCIFIMIIILISRKRSLVCYIRLWLNFF